MNLKDKLLNYFVLHVGETISGEYFADTFSVSRAAIWKAIHTLIDEGYAITSSPNGYCYEKGNDILNEKLILSYASDIPYNLELFDCIDSTNHYAKMIANRENVHGTLIVANQQTAGRGRKGHSFYSPADVGLYLSLILKPHETIDNLLMITIAAAVATCQSIRELSNLPIEIKWVNDLFIEKKKIAGILTEAMTDVETQQVDTIIIGIGINTKSTKLPKDIKDIAGALNVNELSRNQLAATIWQKLLYWTDHLKDPNLISTYRDYSLLIDHQIHYEKNAMLYQGKVIAINDEGNLIVQNDDGIVVTLSSGEVSVIDW